MSANDLALRFSSAPAEALIGVLPVLEVKEALREEVESDVMDEVWTEHNFEMEAMGEQVDETARLARKFECAAEALGTAIKLALTLPHNEAMQVLNDALNDNPDTVANRQRMRDGVWNETCGGFCSGRCHPQQDLQRQSGFHRFYQ